MKKRTISIILILSLLSAFFTGMTVFADDYKNLAVYSTPEKLDVSVSSVTSDTNKLGGFGEAETIFNGIGMIDGISLVEGASVNAAVNNDNTKRWAVDGGSTPTVTITLSEDAEIDIIKWTEARKRIAAFTFTFYNDGAEIYKQSGSFSDSTSSNNVYLRTFSLDQTVVADKIVLKVDSVGNGSGAISVLAMEFYNGGGKDPVSSIKATSGDGLTDLSDGIEAAFDDDTSTSYITDVPETSNSVATKTSITNTKIDTTNVEVELVDGNTAERNTSGGDWDAMFDGRGMVGGFYSNNEGTVTKLIVDGTNYKASSTVSKVKNAERWYVKNATDTPALEIELTAPATFNTVKWTELRKEIKEYTFTFYNGEEKVGDYNGTFDSEDTNTNLFLRTVYLDGEVTADRIVFSIDAVFGSKIVSVTEMEFWNLDADATVSVADGGEASHTSFGGINTIFDGVSTNATATRWTTPAADDLPTITVKFFEDVTLNTIGWSEVRKNIKAFTVTCYKDGVAIFTKDGDLTDEAGGSDAYKRMFDLGQSITADEIKFEVTELNSENVTSIAEMEFWNIIENPGTTPTSDINLFFDYEEIIVADTLYIGSDDVENIKLYGSIDGEDFFEIDCVYEDGFYSFAAEYLISLKIELTLEENCEELEITDIGLYEMNYSEELHFMKSLFNGGDTSYITDESADNITQNIKSLPTSLGSYIIEWRSEDDEIIDVETGVVTKTYVSQPVKIYADFMRNGVAYKTNIYSLVVADDGSLGSTNKLQYSADAVYKNESSHIVSSSAKDKNGLDPTDTAWGGFSTLYDEAHKTGDFSYDNANSWLTPPMTDPAYVYETPITLQFDFDKVIPVSNIDIYEFRDRLRKAHVEISLDGEQWTPVTETLSLSAESANTTSSQAVVKKIGFSTNYAKHIRIVVEEIEETTSYAALKFYEVVFYDKQSMPLINSDSAINLVDRDANTYVEIAENESVFIDLGKIKGFDGLKWTYNTPGVKNYSVSVSNDANTWSEVNNGILSDGHLIGETNFDYQIARFIRLDINSVTTGDCTKIAEIYVTEDSLNNEFVSEKNLAKLIEDDKTDILTDESLLLLTADRINLPEAIGDYSITWDLSQATMINENGDVTHAEEDISGTIGVRITDNSLNFPVYVNEFKLVSRKLFSADDYHIAATKNEFVGNYDFDRPKDLFFKQENTIVEFTIIDEGEVSINSDEELFRINVDENEIAIICKDIIEKIPYNAEEIKVRALLNKDTFNLYINYDGTRYKGILVDAAYLNEFANGINNISTNTALTDVRLGIHKDYIGDFLNQFDFSCISDETMYSVTENLSLPDTIIGLPITWTSSDNNVIDAQTGAVNTSAKPSYVVLTANVNEPDVITWSQEFYASVNLPNIISAGNTTVNVVTYANNSISNIKDGKISTPFLTSSKGNYAITVTFPENTMISQVALVECEKQGNIDAFNIYIDDTLAYSGRSLDRFENCILDNKIGKTVKIEVVSPMGITGFNEIAIHSIPTDPQKAKMDINAVSIASNYQNGEYYLPASGENTSVLSYSSDSNLVTFTNTGTTVTMNVNNTGVATSANITILSSLNGVTASKTVPVVLDGAKEISTKPSGSGGAGGSGGSSDSGGFGGGQSNDLYGGTTSGEDAVSYTPVETKDEISGHWGEKEIRALVEKGIVKGDGNGYNLQKTVTRAEFITMLLRSMGKDLSVSVPIFEDVSAEDWYADEMQTAYELGWIEGYNNTSMPTANITREEMAKIICKAMEIEIVKDTALDFTDKNEQSAWAVEYINSLYSHNIVNGYEDGSFRPKNSLKRDESMIVIYRILNKEGK